MRKYEIDHLRVIAFLLLILYHTGMFFVPWDFHLKNNVVSESFQLPMFFLNQWRLSLLFLLSGMGTYFSISKRNISGFISERFKRLIIPLVFGILVIVPPQIYFERLADGMVFSSYFDYYPKDILNGPYPEGGFSWHHLWFILYLFVFSVLLVVLKKPLDWLADRSVANKNIYKGWFVFLLVCIPSFLSEYYLRLRFPVTHALVNDWFTFCNDLWFFLCGYFFARTMSHSWPVFQKTKYVALTGGIIFFVVLIALPFSDMYIVKAAICAINRWCWLFAIMGLGITFLDKKTKWLSYSNEAVYPFYILHQTAIIAIGYYIRDLGWSVGVKFFIITTGTTLSCWLLYEFVIKRVNLLRLLFGMKPRSVGNTI